MNDAAVPHDPAQGTPLKVLLVANYVPDGQTSMLAFSAVLERELPKQGCEVRVAVPRLVVQRVSTASRLWKWLGYVDKFILFLPELRARLTWADVVHVCDHSNGMYVPRVVGKPNLITCHDVIAIQAALGMVPGWSVGSTGRLLQRLISRGLGRADLVACVSDLTRRDLRALDLAPESRVCVVPNGLNDDFAPAPSAEAKPLLEALGISDQDRYLLHVGNDLDRKNRKTVLETFIALRREAAAGTGRAIVDKLVFVGPELTEPLMAHSRAEGVADRIVTLQGISHPGLRALYSNAVALLFPSLQEGFGWPVIEAQACGCPVFTSDLAPMNEIGGEGAVYVPPEDADAIARAIVDAAPRFGEMRRLGLDNATHYSAHQMAANYIAAYRRVIAARTARKTQAARA